MPVRPESIQQVRPLLELIDGVELVVVDTAQDVVSILCAPDVSSEAILGQATDLLRAEGIEPEDVRLEVTCRLTSREQQRVRFGSVSRAPRSDHRIELRVTLAFNQVTAYGVVETEHGEALELKAVASATIDALRQIVDTDLDLRVAGVKRVRAFDAELMVASLYRPGAPPQQYVGAVVAGDDPYRAATIAVLNALNRLLGNYLAR